MFDTFTKTSFRVIFTKVFQLRLAWKQKVDSKYHGPVAQLDIASLILHRLVRK